MTFLTKEEKLKQYTKKLKLVNAYTTTLLFFILLTLLLFINLL